MFPYVSPGRFSQVLSRFGRICQYGMARRFHTHLEELQGHPKIGASWEGFALERPILLHKRFSAQPATKDILITASYSRSLGGAARAQLPAGGRDVLPLALADDHGEMLAQKDFLEG